MTEEYFRKSVLIPITVKISFEELERLVEIMKKRGVRNRSLVVREAINIYWGLISGVEKTSVGNIVIQNPNIVINAAPEKSGEESKQSVNVNLNLNINISKVKELVIEIHSAAGELYRRLNMWKDRLPAGIYSDLAEPTSKLVNKSVMARKVLEGVEVN